MRISEIETCLQAYDEKKGWGRSLLKEEPHVAELRALYEKIRQDRDRSLTSDELLDLVIICLGKKNWNGSASSDLFLDLFSRLGGKEAYQSLYDKGLLTADHVARIERVAMIYTEQLAELIIFFEEYSPESVILLDELDNYLLCNNTDRLKSLAEDGLLCAEAIRMMGTRGSQAYKLLLLQELHRLGFYNAGILAEVVKDTDDKRISTLYAILRCLGESNCELLTQESVMAVVTLEGNRIFPVKEWISRLALRDLLSQDNFNILLTVGKRVKPETGKHYELNALEEVALNNVLDCFKSAKWNLTRYLAALMLSDVPYQLYLGTNELRKLPLSPEQAEKALDALFQEPHQHELLIKHIQLLLDKDFFHDGALNFLTKHAGNQELAIILLGVLVKYNCCDEDTLALLDEKKLVNLATVEALETLEKNEFLDVYGITMLLKEPEHMFLAATNLSNSAKDALDHDNSAEQENVAASETVGRTVFANKPTQVFFSPNPNPREIADYPCETALGRFMENVAWDDDTGSDDDLSPVSFNFTSWWPQ
ncbi:hypothetical protein [Legionella spiritensis]|uniref:hypothetical protein n=1 Tax=Legionella spiritensis TaxID=452 RepID=UPI000F6CBEBE|nr:hypothetical protein [Legionella spiritensis]VEG90207.1 Uncharacterised protein [Legionella spiritensis]